MTKMVKPSSFAHSLGAIDFVGPKRRHVSTSALVEQATVLPSLVHAKRTARISNKPACRFARSSWIAMAMVCQTPETTVLTIPILDRGTTMETVWATCVIGQTPLSALADLTLVILGGTSRKASIVRQTARWTTRSKRTNAARAIPPLLQALDQHIEQQQSSKKRTR